MKIRQLYLITVILLFVQSNSAFALGEGIQLQQMYIQSIKQYKLLMKQLKTFKASSKELETLRKNATALNNEYKFVKNFSLDRELGRISRDIDSLTNLDRWDSLSDQGKFNLIMKELKRRNMSDKERKVYMARLASLKRLEKLRELKLKEAEKTSAMTDKNLKASSASSSAVLAALELMKKEKEEKKKLLKELEASEKIAYEKDFFKFMKQEEEK